MPATKNPSRQQRKNSLDTHVDDRILQDLLKDARAEMSWRRDVEFRLLQLLLVFYPIIGTVMVQVFQSDNVSIQAFRITTSLIAFLILAVFFFVIQRIYYEHKAYSKLAKQVLKIWLYFRLFESGAYLKDQTFLPTDLLDEKNGLGQGKGYLRTQILIVAITLAVLSLLGALAFLKA